MDDHVAVDEGEVGVYLEDGDVRGLYHLPLVGAGGGEGDVAVLIRHGGGGDEYVGLVAIEPLGSGEVQVVGDIGHVALLVGLAHGRGVEPAVNAEGIHVLGSVEAALVGGVAVDDLDVLHSVRNGVDVFHEQPGLSRAETRDNGVSALHEGESRLQGYDFRSISHR